MVLLGKTEATVSHLTEREIFDRLSTSLGDAISGCVALAEQPKTGEVYRKLVDDLQLVEGCCRQAAFWREDARWLQFAPQVEGIHQKVGDLLRGRYPRQAFKTLAGILEMFRHMTLDVRDKATGRVGAIMPRPAPAPHRDTRPVQVLLPPGFKKPLKSNIILPPGFGE